MTGRLEAERKAAEIRIRAERKAGELLREMKETGKRQDRAQPVKLMSSATTLLQADIEPHDVRFSFGMSRAARLNFCSKSSVTTSKDQSRPAGR